MRPAELGEDINDWEAPGSSFKEPFRVQELWLLGVGRGQSHIYQVRQEILSPHASRFILFILFEPRPCSFPKEYRSKIFQRKGKLEPCRTHAHCRLRMLPGNGTRAGSRALDRTSGELPQAPKRQTWIKVRRLENINKYFKYQLSLEGGGNEKLSILQPQEMPHIQCRACVPAEL